MGQHKRFVLDANVFIEAHRRYYAFDICPDFWIALIQQHEAGRLCSIDRVRKELSNAKPKDEDEPSENQEDELSKWVREPTRNDLFKSTADKDVIKAYRGMVNWVQNDLQLRSDAKEEFASGADGWLVAYAMANGLTVVTHETFDPYAKN